MQLLSSLRAFSNYSGSNDVFRFEGSLQQLWLLLGFVCSWFQHHFGLSPFEQWCANYERYLHGMPARCRSSRTVAPGKSFSFAITSCFTASVSSNKRSGQQPNQQLPKPPFVCRCRWNLQTRQETEDAIITEEKTFTVTNATAHIR
jgi:hypothetical protein